MQSHVFRVQHLLLSVLFLYDDCVPISPYSLLSFLTLSFLGRATSNTWLRIHVSIVGIHSLRSLLPQQDTELKDFCLDNRGGALLFLLQAPQNIVFRSFCSHKIQLKGPPLELSYIKNTPSCDVQAHTQVFFWLWLTSSWHADCSLSPLFPTWSLQLSDSSLSLGGRIKILEPQFLLLSTTSCTYWFYRLEFLRHLLFGEGRPHLPLLVCRGFVVALHSSSLRYAPSTRPKKIYYAFLFRIENESCCLWAPSFMQLSSTFRHCQGAGRRVGAAEAG